MVKFFKILKKKEPELSEKQKIEMVERNSFLDTVNYAKEIANSKHDRKDKIMMLEYILDVIKRDLQIQGLKEVLYKKEAYNHKKVPSPLFFIFKRDANGNQCGQMLGLEKDKRIWVDLKKDLIITCPWHRDKLLNSLKTIINNDFVYKDNNHRAFYYTELDICSIYNGYHSIASGIFHKKGQIEAVVVNTKTIIEKIYTPDGIHWCDKENNQNLGKVNDFRVGALLEILRIKLEIENNNMNQARQ